MGSQFVTDPFWGSFGASTMRDFEGAPAKALQSTHLAEGIVDERIKRAREKEAHDLGLKLGDEMAETLRPTPVEPTHTVGPMVGDVNNPPAGIPEGDFIDPGVRSAAAANDARKAQVAAEDAIRYATLTGKLEQLYPMRGQGHAMIAGRPTPLDQFETTGRMPTAEERSVPAMHNMAIYALNPDTGREEPTGRFVSTFDNKTDASTGQPLTLNPGERLLGIGAAGTEPPNPFKGSGEALERLNVLDKVIRSQGGQVTPEQADLVEKLAPVAYEIERVREQESDGHWTTKYVAKKEVPPWIGRLMGISQPATATTTITPDAGGAGPGTGDGTVEGDPAANPLAALLPPPDTAPAVRDPNAERIVSEGPVDARELRKEYAETKRFQAYDKAAKTWNASVLGTYANDKAADTALVYGFVRMLDDLTGVREGETKNAAEIGGLKEWLLSYKGRLTGEGLPPEVRVQIIKTMKRYVDEVAGYAQSNEKFYTDVAKQGHLAPKAVLPELPPLVEFDEAKARRVGTPASPPSPRDAARALVGGQ
jgi:hypothetical protein